MATVALDNKAAVSPDSRFLTPGFGAESFTVGNNPNRVLIAICETGALSTVSGLAWDGVAMTQLFSDSIPGSIQAVQFFAFALVAPNVGTLNFTVTASGSQDVYCNAYSFYNAAQSLPTLYNKSAQGTSTQTASVTAAGGEYGVGMAFSGFSVPTGFSLSGDASSNQLGINAWFTGDTNGTVAAGTRTAVSNYSSGGSSVQAGIILVSPYPDHNYGFIQNKMKPAMFKPGNAR